MNPHPSPPSSHLSRRADDEGRHPTLLHALLLSLLCHALVLTLVPSAPAPESMAMLAQDRPSLRPLHRPVTMVAPMSAAAAPKPVHASPPEQPSPDPAPPPPHDARAPDHLKNTPHKPSETRAAPPPPTSEGRNSPDEVAANVQAQDASGRRPTSQPGAAHRAEDTPVTRPSAPPEQPSLPEGTASSPEEPASTGDTTSSTSNLSQTAAPGGPVAASSASRTPAATSPGEDRAALRASYLRALVPDVAGQHFYPGVARRLGLEGRVLVALTIDARGDVVALAVHRSSGHRALDEAAITALRRLPRLPPPPAALLVDGHLQVLVPMNYRLTGAPP